jgi:ribonuclease BN (tRNA processing enzyme)
MPPVARRRSRGPVSITFLGSGDAFHSGGRRSSSYLVQVRGIAIVIDCGPTTPYALRACGTAPGGVHALLQTHFHGDHVLGLPMLILHQQYLGGPPGGLAVFGPAGLEELVMQVYGLVYPGAAGKLRGDRSRRVRWNVLRPGSTAKLPGGAGTVSAHPVSHNPESLGYRLEVAGRIVAFTGDTRWDDRLPELTRGADLLVIDCTSYAARHGDHLQYREIVEHREDLGADRIILSHLGSDVLANARRLALERARDGLVVRL